MLSIRREYKTIIMDFALHKPPLQRLTWQNAKYGCRGPDIEPYGWKAIEKRNGKR